MCVCVCTHVGMYFTDSHIHGMLLAFGIIYKARLLCGALSPCLLPLQPMTLPGFPSAASALLAACPVQENGFGVLSKHVAVTSFQKYSLFMLVKDLIWSDLVLCKKKKSFSCSERHNLWRQTQSIHFTETCKVMQTHPIWP